MKKLLIGGLAFIATLGAYTPASADNYSEDVHYIYRETPWSEAFTNEVGLTQISQMASRGLMSFLRSARDANLLPSAVDTVADMDNFSRGQDRITDMVKYLNNYIGNQRRRGGSFSRTDLLPKGILVFGGTSLSGGLAKSLGGTVHIGMLVMPVRVEKRCKAQNPAIPGCTEAGALVDTYYSVRNTFIAWPTAEVGLGVGGSAGFRIGLGLIWDLNDSWVRPEQFYGMGAGSAVQLHAGMGVSGSAGIVANWDMPGAWFDFAYVLASVNLAPGAEASARLTATPFLSLAAVMGLFDSASRSTFEQVVRDINKQMIEELRQRVIGPMNDRIRAMEQGHVLGEQPTPHSHPEQPTESR